MNKALHDDVFTGRRGGLKPTGRFGRAGGEINCLSVLKI